MAKTTPTAARVALSTALCAFAAGPALADDGPEDGQIQVQLAIGAGPVHLLSFDAVAACERQSARVRQADGSSLDVELRAADVDGASWVALEFEARVHDADGERHVSARPTVLVAPGEPAEVRVGYADTSLAIDYSLTVITGALDQADGECGPDAPQAEVVTQRTRRRQRVEALDRHR